MGWTFSLNGTLLVVLNVSCDDVKSLTSVDAAAIAEISEVATDVRMSMGVDEFSDQWLEQCASAPE